MRLAITARLSLLLVSASLTACSPKDTASTDNRLEALEDSVTMLTEALRASVDLKPGDGSFSVLRLDVGSLAITLDSVRPSGSGSLLSLSVANLTSAEIDGLIGTMGWGVPLTDGTHAVDERRSRPLNLSQPLPPGSWTRISVALDSVPPDQIGFFRLGEASATSLRLP
jgi:hypothetical protein